jgi:hypothetical protein
MATMPYSAQSPILRQTLRSEVDLDALTAWAVANGAKRGEYLDEFFGVLLAGSLYTGIDFWLLVGQSHLETNGWTSDWWVNRGNPAGLGITGDPTQNANSQTWTSGADSAFALLSHMTAYLHGEDWIDHWNESWPDPIDVNKRFTAPIRAGYRASVLDDLNGTWAIDPDNNYGGKIAARANMIRNAVGKEGPLAIVYGKVPHPPFEKHIIRKDPNHGVTYIDGTRGRPVGCIHHEWMDGGDAGEAFYKGFFACPNGGRHTDACVDYIILRSGKIIQINDPEGNRIPWASGGSGPYQGDGGAFVRRFGASAVNRRLVSWEYTKRDNDNLTEAQIQAGGALAAYWHDHDEQPWDQHPYVPKYGCVTSLLHHEVQGTSCGLDMYDDIAKVQGVTKAIMRHYQEVVALPPPVEPVYAPRHPVDPGMQVINNRLYLAIERGYTLTKNATPREWAEPTSAPTGPDLKAGTQISASHVVKDAGVESNLTLVLVNGDRIPASAVA